MKRISFELKSHQNYHSELYQPIAYWYSGRTHDDDIHYIAQYDVLTPCRVVQNAYDFI